MPRLIEAFFLLIQLEFMFIQSKSQLIRLLRRNSQLRLLRTRGNHKF